MPEVVQIDFAGGPEEIKKPLLIMAVKIETISEKCENDTANYNTMDQSSCQLVDNDMEMKIIDTLSDQTIEAKKDTTEEIKTLSLK